jgi:Transglycosylase SLT domain.
MSNLISVVELFLVLNQCTPDVHPRTMAAIVEAESSRNIYAINVNSQGYNQPKPQTLEDAKATFESLKSQGLNFDAGLAQINSGNFDAYGLTSENVFDPCTNVATGGDILKQNFLNASESIADEQDALIAAISAYNTGNYQRGLKNGYVDRVKGKASTIVVPDIESVVSATEQVRQKKVSSQDEKEETTAHNWRVFGSSKQTTDVFSGSNKKSALVFNK